MSENTTTTVAIETVTPVIDHPMARIRNKVDGKFMQYHKLYADQANACIAAKKLMKEDTSLDLEVVLFNITEGSVIDPKGVEGKMEKFWREKGEREEAKLAALLAKKSAKETAVILAAVPAPVTEESTPVIEVSEPIALVAKKLSGKNK